MDAGRRDLLFTRGDDYSHVISFEDANGNPSNLTGAVFAAQLRTYADAIDDVPFTVDNTEVAIGVVTLSLTAIQTAALARINDWDLQMTLSGAVTTVLAGTVTVPPDVTR